MMNGSNYFDYPHRRQGLDHGLFDMRYLKSAPGIRWGQGKSLALWLAVDVEFFPLDMPAKPFMPTGGPARPYPDIWNYSTRDYGNRVGLYRMMRTLDALGARATAFVQSSVAERYPVLVRDLVKSGWEMAAGGIDMGHLHHCNVDRDVEQAWVRQSVDVLQQAVGQKIQGWHSPASSESTHTPELVAAAGLDYIVDWSNDDQPYPMHVGDNALLSFPLSCELSDKRILFEQHQTLAAFESQMLAAYEVLKAEATPERGRVLSISLSPWVMGQPYRIKALERVLRVMLADPAVFSATAADMLPAIQSTL